MRIPNILITLTATILLTGVGTAANGQASWDQDIRRSEAAKAISDAEKAAWEAKSAALDAIQRLPGYSGEVSLGQKAGETEAALLAAKAVDVAAQSIVDMVANSICKSNKSTILLYADDQSPNFQAYVEFKVRIDLVGAVIDATFAILGSASSSVGLNYTPVATAGIVLSALDTALGFLRTDYTVAGTDLTFGDSMLVHALANKLANNVNGCEKGWDVLLPAVYNPAIQSDLIPYVKNEIRDLYLKRQVLKKKLDELKKKLEITEENGESQAGEEIEDVVQLIKTLESVLAFCDDFFSKLISNKDSDVPLGDVLKEAALIERLDKSGYLLIVKLHKAGGSQYTKKRLFSSIFTKGPAFYHMGGVVVSFVLLNHEGSVKHSGVVPVHGGFVQDHELKKYLEKDL